MNQLQELADVTRVMDEWTTKRKTAWEAFMKLLTLACALMWTAALTLHPADGQEAKPPQLKCDIGPVDKTYGKTQWLVYSCDDGRTLVIVTAPGNPALPFYFMFSPHEGGYQLSGEGTGSKATTDAAFNELQTLSERDIMTLIDQTKPK
jgi:hypothetical protein